MYDEKPQWDEDTMWCVMCEKDELACEISGKCKNPVLSKHQPHRMLEIDNVITKEELIRANAN